MKVHLLILASIHHAAAFLITSQLEIAHTVQSNAQKRNQTRSDWGTAKVPTLSSAVQNDSPTANRRTILQQSFFSTAGVLYCSSAATASTGEGGVADVLLSRDQVAALLHPIPTFTIVDGAGVPYMVVGEDAKVTAYFFVSYEEAARILKLAITSADQSIKEAKRSGEDSSMDPQQLSNPWRQARISTLPLDTALTISLQSSGGSLRSYFQVAATESDIEDALIATGKDDIQDGKIPLFYYADFVDANGQSPLYFSKPQLEKAFQSANPRGIPLPDMKVTELLSVLRLLVQSSENNEGANVVFVPPVDSFRRAQQCEKKGGSNPPLVLGKRNVVL